jgi:3-oxoadipate enol-lactonase
MPLARLADAAIHYEEDGETGSTPLVLSNPLGTSFEVWEPQMPTLSARFRVIRYDNRGHGQSQVTPGPYSIEQLASDALAVMDDAGVSHAHFCGLSMGGIVGMWIAIHAPQRIGRLVVANAAAKIGTAETWDARIEAVRNGGTQAIAPAIVARWFTTALLERPTPMVSKVRATLERMSADGYAAACAAVRDADLRYMLGRIHAPTLVIAGADDLTTTPDDGHYLVDHIPNARYVELPAAHLSNIQAARAFTQALLQFLTGRTR